jgi:superfamily II DNA or RNA helicase
MSNLRSTAVNSKAEDLFVTLFCETFGPDKANNLYVQYPFSDIYGGRRYIDFALEGNDMKIAIEIDGETYHNPKKVSDSKYYDDLLKQNSLIFDGWEVYRWAYAQMKNYPEKFKDEIKTFLSKTALFKDFDKYLPKQTGDSFSLRDYQQEALDNLEKMRGKGDTIALLYHATGVGKTITACMDAKKVGGRTLFLVNALKLADQASDKFAELWPEASRGPFTGTEKDKDADVIFATVQSISRNLLEFSPDSFDYIIVDECHHSAAKTYQQIFSYFKPRFILGLSATPERSDGQNMLELFQNVAHKMDLKTAIEKNILVPIRCVRIKTDVDISDVRINGIKYNSQDLESKLFVPERNNIIVDTYCDYVNGKKCVIFCASVNTAKAIALLLKEKGVNAEAVSGSDCVITRNKVIEQYEKGNINVLCACDLLNEGWDSPHTEVLFMARPTMSKTIYMQQLGRGTRKCDGKTDLLVFDFVDNANLFNAPYSLHRLLDIGNYRPLEYVLAPENKKMQDLDLFRRGEKPIAYIDMPINVLDYQVVDLFNWQKEVKNMISQIELLRMIDIQKTTLTSYIKEGRIKPDIEIPLSEARSFKYFYRETVDKYAKDFNWKIITPQNIKSVFMDYITEMDMVLSYKPVLMKAMLDHCSDDGIVRIVDIVTYFIDFYEDRRQVGLFVENQRSIFAKGNYSKKDVEQLIFRYPFDVMSQMNFVKRDRNIETVSFNDNIFSELTDEDRITITKICDSKINEYYKRNIDK